MCRTLLCERQLLPLPDMGEDTSKPRTKNTHRRQKSSPILQRSTSKKRKVEQMEEEEEDFCEAIKRLYSEESETVSMRMSCSTEVLQEATEGSSGRIKNPSTTVSAN